MKLKVWFALALLVVCTSVFAEDPKPKPMSPEEQAMMAAWQKYMTPSEGHKQLDGMIGTWDATVTSTMAPGAPPMVSKGTETNTWVLGGRYVEQKFTGSFMGQPFHGIGYAGYDNAKKEFFGTWIDSMSTGLMTQTGTASADGMTWTFKSTGTDPMTGKDMPGETKLFITDKNHHKMEMYMPGPDGKMFKSMEIAYTRHAAKKK